MKKLLSKLAGVGTWLAAILAGAAVVFFATRAREQKKRAEENAEIVWRHKAGSIYEDLEIANAARDRMLEHEKRAKKARQQTEAKIDEIAKYDPDLSALLDRWNVDRLRDAAAEHSEDGAPAV
jgi:hypothetical protein